MGRSPRMLAGFVQSSLDAIDAIDWQLGRAVRRALKPETLDTIEVSSPRALVSVDLDVELTECFFREAGAERARATLRESLRQSVERPLLLGAGFRLLGRAPARIARWAPRVWGLVYRDAGEMRLERSSPGGARLALHDLPLVIASSAHYLDGTAQTFAGFLEGAGVRGRVEIEGPDPGGRSAAFELRWTT